MLERFSSQIQSVAILLIVAMLIVVFASTFGGPQSQGCAGGTRPAVNVRGASLLDGSESFTDGAFYAAMRLGFNNTPAEELQRADARVHTANGIVERVLLADEARRLGLRVTPEQALLQILRRGEIYNTVSVDAPSYMRPTVLTFPMRDDDGNIERERLERFVEGLRRTMGEFEEWQAEEILAERMRQIVRAGAVVAPGEVWDAYVQENEKAMIRYVRFSGAYYGDRLTPSTAELDAFIASHQQAVNDEFAANRAQYQGLEEQVRARHILIKVDASADEATKAAARARATALLARARAADSAGFSALARAESGDTGSARKGGDLGWNARGRMVPAFDEAQFALQAGQTSDVVESNFGFHIIRVEGRRQGDVPEQDAKREIAERLYRAEQGRVVAQREAAALLARLKSGTSLDAIESELEPTVPDGQTAPERDPQQPSVETSSEFGPGQTPIAELANGYVVSQAAFALTTENPFPAEPVTAGDDIIVFRLESIAHATREGLTPEVRTRLLGMLRGSREEEAVESYVRSLRGRAEREGRITVNPTILRYGDEEGEESESGENEEG